MDEHARPVSLPPLSSALAAPFQVAGRELSDLASRPLPMVGGVFGSLLGCVALTAALLWAPSPAAAEEQPFTVEFVPASLVSSGEPEGVAEQPVEPLEASPPAEPESELEVEPEEPSERVSEDASNPAQAEPEPPKPSPPQPTPTPTPEPEVTPTPAPPPPPGTEIQSPFQDPDGWSDLVREGDPWATAVLAALREMQVPAWAGKIESGQPYSFRMRVCTNGRVDKVFRKGSTGNTDLDATLAHEVSRLKLPPMPASMRSQIPGSCATLKYTFAWTVSGVR